MLTEFGLTVEDFERVRLQNVEPPRGAGYLARTGSVGTLLLLEVCCLTLIGIVALGVMISLLTILWRQTGSVPTVIFILFEMLADACFPVSAFPVAIKYVAFAVSYP